MMADKEAPRKNSSYWSVDIPGMTESQAHELLAWLAKSMPSLIGIPADPAKFLTVHMDRDSVNAIRHALTRDQDVNPITDGLIDMIDEWLDQADDS
jgi:hypothetical protein